MFWGVLFLFFMLEVDTLGAFSFKLCSLIWSCNTGGSRVGVFCVENMVNEARAKARLREQLHQTL